MILNLADNSVVADAITHPVFVWAAQLLRNHLRHFSRYDLSDMKERSLSATSGESLLSCLLASFEY